MIFCCFQESRLKRVESSLRHMHLLWWSTTSIIFLD
uniref:Uncharacterized protein n=1 Tax=Rhizophora mucronata TaxID=61149 RepID=A0A2P2LLA1_RHIMU